jgi:ABC-type Fe3+-hydroxamate transport system substrate-binding protein
LEEFRNVYRLIGVILYGGFIGEDEGDTVFAEINRACNNPEAFDLGDFVYITENMLIATGDTLESAILSCFGNNLAKDGAGYIFDKEDLLENQPDVILLNSSLSIDELLADEIFSELDAVVNDRIVTLNNLFFERPSSRIVTLITEMQVKYRDLL